jgi:hypothetical protein
VTITYREKRGSATAACELAPTRPKLAAAAHITGPWPHLNDALRAALAAMREVAIENDRPASPIPADDLSIEMIERVGDLDQVDRYLLRLVLGALCRGAAHKARTNGHT